MSPRTPQKFLTGLTLAAALLCAALPAVAGDHPSSQVVFEVGYVHPYGNLAEDFFGTDKGFGIKEGLELGFRWRYRFSENWSISPAFHFTDYKNFSGENEEVGAYRIKPTTLLYDLELMYVMGREDSFLRPLIAISAGVSRNRVEGYYKTWDKAFDSSVSAPHLSARAGILVSGFEFTAAYNFNQFDTWRFFNTGYEESYNWNNLVIRVGWIIPFS
jgi:hypothetical protein